MKNKKNVNIKSNVDTEFLNVHYFKVGGLFFRLVSMYWMQFVLLI